MRCDDVNLIGLQWMYQFLLNRLSDPQMRHAASRSRSTEMSDQCQVCNEPAAGFHFGAFTCEGCKSFFGRLCDGNALALRKCTVGGKCEINKRTRTSCKACRYQKCLTVGMSKQFSRYGRRSEWFKMQHNLGRKYNRHSKHQANAREANVTAATQTVATKSEINPIPSRWNTLMMDFAQCQQQQQQQQQANSDAIWNLPSTSRDMPNAPALLLQHLLLQQSNSNLDMANLYNQLLWKLKNHETKEMLKTMIQSVPITSTPTPKECVLSPTTSISGTSATIPSEKEMCVSSVLCLPPAHHELHCPPLRMDIPIYDSSFYENSSSNESKYNRNYVSSALGFNEQNKQPEFQQLNNAALTSLGPLTALVSLPENTDISEKHTISWLKSDSLTNSNCKQPLDLRVRKAGETIKKGSYDMDLYNSMDEMKRAEEIEYDDGSMEDAMIPLDLSLSSSTSVDRFDSQFSASW